MTRLWKTTIVVWSGDDPSGVEIDMVARDAIDGDSFCSVRRSEVVADAEADSDWVGTEFFDLPGVTS